MCVATCACAQCRTHAGCNRLWVSRRYADHRTERARPDRGRGVAGALDRTSDLFAACRPTVAWRDCPGAGRPCIAATSGIQSGGGDCPRCFQCHRCAAAARLVGVRAGNRFAKDAGPPCALARPCRSFYGTRGLARGLGGPRRRCHDDRQHAAPRGGDTARGRGRWRRGARGRANTRTALAQYRPCST